MAAGGHDNVTAVVLDVVEVRPDEPAPAETAAMPSDELGLPPTATMPSAELGLPPTATMPAPPTR